MSFLYSSYRFIAIFPVSFHDHVSKLDLSPSFFMSQLLDDVTTIFFKHNEDPNLGSYMTFNNKKLRPILSTIQESSLTNKAKPAANVVRSVCNPKKKAKIQEKDTFRSSKANGTRSTIISCCNEDCSNG